MYFFAFSVVAPCCGPVDHVHLFMCMPHQMPTYFIGLIQSAFGRRLGGFRFRPNTEGARSLTRSAVWSVRQGVLNGVWPRTFTPSTQGCSAACSTRLSMPRAARNMRG